MKTTFLLVAVAVLSVMGIGLYAASFIACAMIIASHIVNNLQS